LGVVSGSDWFSSEFRAQFDQQSADIGRFNLAIFGKTGVGKSTLINAIFDEEVAETGIGAPVTKGSKIYVDQYGHLGLVDTQGLEVGRDDREILSELDKATKEMRKLPLSEQIHVAWFCVRGMDRRFEDAEAEFIRRLDKLGLPVIMVLTQVPMRDGHYHPDAIRLAEHIRELGLPIYGGRPFLTNALADPFTGTGQHGLLEVLDASFRVAPEGAQLALTAAQTIDQKRKVWAAQQAIVIAAGSAATAAAVPIPFSDAAVLVPIQLGLMSRIAHIYKIKVERAALMAVATTTAATQGGRAAFTGLLKLVPGAGTIAGGAIGAAVASSFTFALGQAWLVVCQKLVAGQLADAAGTLSTNAVRDAFMSEFTKRLSIRRK
jgi:uncharacterized protein (DUF697 family)/GTP-binding protein EngB required for normal cell division